MSSTHNIVYFGTTDFSSFTLEKLILNQWNIISVVTQPARDQGRNLKAQPTPVYITASRYHIPVFFKLNTSTIKELQKNNPDIGIIFAYGDIIPDACLKIFPHGILNIHPSLLPKYRGPSPVQFALLNGETSTGVTVMKIDNKMDHGPILEKKFLHIGENDNLQKLMSELTVIGTELLLNLLPQYLSHKVALQPQNDSLATYTALISRKDGKVNWKCHSSQNVMRMYKAYHPWPGIFSFFNNKRLKFIKIHIGDSNSSDTKIPGEVFQNAQGKICIKCAHGYIEVLVVQQEGKKETSILDFLKGYPHLIGAILQ